MSEFDRDECGRICLSSLDFIRILKFNLSGVSHPRIAIAAGSEKWGRDNWVSLCGILEEKTNAGIIQLGKDGEEFFGFGKNIIARTDIRESAAVISRCDLVVCEDNEYGALASAVETPCIVIGSDGFDCETEDISLAMVIDSIVQLCGNAKDAE